MIKKKDKDSAACCMGGLLPTLCFFRLYFLAEFVLENKEKNKDLA